MDESLDTIKENIKTGFTITKIPIGELKRFKQVVSEIDPSNECYATTLIRLMDLYDERKNDVRFFLLLQKLAELEELVSKKETEKKSLKTFGMR